MMALKPTIHLIVPVERNRVNAINTNARMGHKLSIIDVHVTHSRDGIAFVLCAIVHNLCHKIFRSKHENNCYYENYRSCLQNGMPR